MKNCIIKIGIVLVILLISGVSFVYAADTPIAVIDNMSDLIFGVVRGIGIILLVFSIVQIGLSLKSHDPVQRASGFWTFAGGVFIVLAKEIVTLITN